MGKLIKYLAVTVIVFFFALSACTKSSEQEAEKGVVDKMTDQAADAAVKKIKTPLDKARATQDLGDDRLQAMDEALQKQ